VTANGGTAPYSFNWSNGENSSSISNLSAGTYTVDIVDQNFCSITKTINIQGIDCSGLSLNVTSTDETYFQLNDGTAMELPLIRSSGQQELSELQLII